MNKTSMLSSAPHPTPPSSQIFVVRLTPGSDLKASLLAFAAANNIRAGVVLTCVGSLVQYNLRFANKPGGTLRRGHFEVLSLSGTLSASSAHLHLCVADESGASTGGHLLDKNVIYTTAEIAIIALRDMEFERLFDPDSGYNELSVKHNADENSDLS